MVKMQAVQSALAVRRQRSRREEAKKAKQRRESRASTLSSSPRASVVSLDGRVYFDEGKDNKKLFGQVTMFHVGGVLILIGLMLVITALMPQYVKSTSVERRNDLLGTGCFFVFLGAILTTISRFVSNSEEEELNEYIKARLARSKSGHRLTKDVESAGQTPARERRNKPTENGVGHNSPRKIHEAGDHSHTNGQICNESLAIESTSTPSTAFSEVSPDYIAIGIDSPIPASASTEPVLSRILEEDELELETDATTEPLDSTPESSISPTSPLETQGLLDRHHSPRSSSKSSVKSSCKSVKMT